MRNVSEMVLRICLFTLVWVIGCDDSSNEEYHEPPARPYVAPLPNAHVYGVFVSVRRYARGQPVRPRPVPREAEMLRDRFQRESIVQPGQIVTLQDEQATVDHVLDTLYSMRDRVRPSDTFVLFLSTHGREERLQMYDGEVSAGSIDRQLRRIDARAILIVIHACQSGSFASIVHSPNRIGVFSSPADSYSYDAVGYGGYGFLAFDAAVLEMGEYSSRVRDTNAYYSDELIAKMRDQYPWLQVAFCTRSLLDTPIALWNSREVPTPEPPPVAPTPPSLPQRQQRRFRHHRH